MGKLGIIGATGWLGHALGENLLTQGLWPAQDLVLLNRSGPSKKYAAHPGVAWARDATEVCDQCETIVLSVRPEDFPVPGFAPQDHLVISFMAAWTLERLQTLAPKARIVRTMPSGGATTRQSYTPWVAGAGVLDPDIALTARLLSAIGTEDQVENEAQLDYLSALSGSGAAYPALMAQAMLDHARRNGLSDHVAMRAVEAVICGSAGILTRKMAEVGAVIEAYMSYRGITAAGLSAARTCGFPEAISAALDAASAKARSMGRD
ncbi:MAG: NAD(P)-binding domain-containing protein [Gemmobacter sp.]|jgi:pyrroline-5-carboxylate reductase|nr:NAD(P)-binding domain-containing protein [Gemmobacter sp.]